MGRAWQHDVWNVCHVLMSMMLGPIHGLPCASSGWEPELPHDVGEKLRCIMLLLKIRPILQ